MAKLTTHHLDTLRRSLRIIAQGLEGITFGEPAAAAIATYGRALTQRNTLLRRIREEQASRAEAEMSAARSASGSYWVGPTVLELQASAPQ